MMSRKRYDYEISESDIDYLMNNTDFTRDQIIQWFNDFKKQCPNGKLDKNSFISLYKKLIPGDTKAEEKFCEYVFNVFDEDESGYIDFCK